MNVKRHTTRATIDRIEDGFMVVVEIDDMEQTVDLPLALFPEETVEGKVIALTIEFVE